jgi:hypothetical protein
MILLKNILIETKDLQKLVKEVRSSPSSDGAQ